MKIVSCDMVISNLVFLHNLALTVIRICLPCFLDHQ